MQANTHKHVGVPTPCDKPYIFYTLNLSTGQQNKSNPTSYHLLKATPCYLPLGNYKNRQTEKLVLPQYINHNMKLVNE